MNPAQAFFVSQECKTYNILADGYAIVFSATLQGVSVELLRTTRHRPYDSR
jgi:hypothetical protein